jgi:hypothetical protein
MTKPTLVATTDNADLPPALPSPNVAHATTYQNETQVRLSAFEAGIVGLQAEIDGQQDRFVSKMEKLKIEYERQTAALTTEHDANKAELLGQVDDMRLGKAMAEAALDAWNNGKEGEANT